MEEKLLTQRFQILSLDGGGIKGLFSAAVLAAIEEDAGIDITDHFDLIAGTSTGGIIALGLGLGMRPREIVEFYINEGPKIFHKWYGVKWFQQWLYCKFSSKPLEEALKACFQNKTLGDSKKPLVIPSYNLGENDIYLFRTPHNARLRRDYKVPAWKVALGTSAAPTFFPCSRSVDNMRLIDGGVWANNPSMVAIVEAVGTMKVSLDSISLLSIGTSDEVVAHPKRLDKGGLFAWAKSSVDIIMRGQNIGVNNQTKFLLGKERYERFNPMVVAGEFSLDGVHKADDLLGKAAHWSRSYTPIFEEKFKKHIAPVFIPLYRIEENNND